MRLLVIADSHGRRDAVDSALFAAGHIDACVHLGDHASDGEYLRTRADAGVYVVRGNCDIVDSHESDLVFEFGGRRVLATHGHTYGVKNGVDRLWYRAKEAGAEIALYGHTHTPYEEMSDGILILNPGTLAGSYAHGSTYAVVTVDADGRISSRLFKLQ